MKLLIPLICVVIAVCTTETVLELRAVRGRDARLPCGLDRVFLDGPESYVIWLKNEKTLLYRFPSEEPERRYAHIPREPSLNFGCKACQDDTALVLKNLDDSGAGLYRCRVHYQTAASEDYIVQVRLVDAPSAPRILKDYNDITDGFIGPVGLHSDFELTCKVDDVKTFTRIYWRHNGALIDQNEGDSLPGKSTITVRNTNRAHLDSVFECLVQNSDVSEPLRTSVPLKMFLPPISVQIRLNDNFDFETGQPRVVDCVVVGCVPPPTVTWQLGDTHLRPTVHKELHDGNYTVSSLTLAPSLKDHNQSLICRAYNSYMPNEHFEDTVSINVGYRPSCVSGSDEPIGIVPGETESIRCVLDSIPEPLQFTWAFSNSHVVYTSVQKVPHYATRYYSTLTWVPRLGDLGVVQCRATNHYGEQKRPCAYPLIRGGPPVVPECVLCRGYPSGVKVQCKKGWSGGRPQTIHLEVFDREFLVLNITDAEGNFDLSDIDDSRNLTAVVYASSKRGRSEKRTMHIIVGTEVAEELEALVWPHWMEATAGIASVLIAGFCAIICVLIIRTRTTRRDPSPDIVPRTDGMYHHGNFHREPDFAREDRPLTTNITVNQMSSGENQQYSPPSRGTVPTCRVLVGCHSPEAGPALQHSCYV